MHSSMNIHEYLLTIEWVYMLMNYKYAHLLYLKYGLITLLIMFI